jgi:hypothetical protein
VTKQRKMVDLVIEETSGVDHPAHLHEGWVVCKSAPAARVEDAFGSLNTTKEAPVPDLIKNADGATETVETVTKEEHDAVVAELAALKAAPAAEVVEPAADEDLLKAVPEAVREMLKARDVEIAKARADVAKERDARLDGEAITKSREVFKSLAFNHDEVAPALRRVAAIDEALAKSLTEVLKAAEGQLAAAGLFSEVGAVTKSADSGTAGSRLDVTAKAMVEKGLVPTYAQGIAKALEADPSLYTEYQNEKAGK